MLAVDVRTLRSSSNVRFFDVIFDRASVTHNDEKSIKNAIDLAYKKLKINGYYIAVDWFSTKHSSFLKGKPIGDSYTKTSFTSGTFCKIGKVHFFNIKKIKKIFNKFKILHLEEKLICNRLSPKKSMLSSWLIVAKKIK